MSMLYKVTGPDGAAWHGGAGKWTPGQWRTVEPPIDPCSRGLHFCRRDQLIHWLGPVIWTFENGDEENTVDAGDKMVTTRGRIVDRVENWNEATARLFAADCAELALKFIPEGHRDPFVRSINAARGFAWAAAQDAAQAAAWAAARDAAWAAQRAAAWAAARAAVRDAAWDAAAAAETEILFDYLEGRRA